MRKLLGGTIHISKVGVVLAAVAALSLLLSACNLTGGPIIQPQPSAQPGCTLAVNPGSGSTSTNLALTNGIAMPNPWNIGSSEGWIQQCYNNGSFSTAMSLANISYKGLGPGGYAEMAYGYSGWDSSFCITSGCAVQPFPLTVSSFANDGYWANVNYTLGVPSPSDLPYDFTYDLWLEQNPSSAGPQAGDFEVMIEPYNTGLHPVQVPLSSSQQFSETIKVNGNNTPSTWTAYKAYGGTSAPTIVFLLNSPAQQSSTSISLKIQDFLAEAGVIAGENISGYTLMGAELGTEYGRNPLGPSDITWSWQVNSYTLSSPSSTIHIIGNS
jgi:hypothetical protein